MFLRIVLLGDFLLSSLELYLVKFCWSVQLVIINNYHTEIPYIYT